MLIEAFLESHGGVITSRSLGVTNKMRFAEAATLIESWYLASDKRLHSYHQVLAEDGDGNYHVPILREQDLATYQHKILRKQLYGLSRELVDPWELVRFNVDYPIVEIPELMPDKKNPASAKKKTPSPKKKRQEHQMQLKEMNQGQKEKVGADYHHSLFSPINPVAAAMKRKRPGAKKEPAAPKSAVGVSSVFNGKSAEDANASPFKDPMQVDEMQIFDDELPISPPKPSAIASSPKNKTISTDHSKRYTFGGKARTKK